MKRGDVKLAAGWQLFDCEDPTCGPHVVALDDDGEPICEIVMSPKHALEFIQRVQDLLYEKAVKRLP